MIIDQYYPDPEGQAWFYKRWRNADGDLIEQHISPDEFNPYFWIPANTKRRVIDKVAARFPGSSVDYESTAVGLDDVPLIRMNAYRPNEIRDMKDEFYRTYEADVRYHDRYLIDSVPDLPEWTPRIWYFDIEAVYVGSKEEVTTVICIYDTYNEKTVTFSWSPERAAMKERGEAPFTYDIIERNDLFYHSYLYGSEEAVLEGFLQYMDECDPDVFVAHGANFFDIPHLIRRLGDRYERLSPLLKVRRPVKKGFYDATAQPIYGRLVFDTAASADKDGGGFERVWKDSGKGKFPNRKLNTIAQELGIGAKHDVDASDWTIWEGTHPDISFDDYVDYCVQDVMLLRDIDERLHALDFFLAMQRFCGVCFESTHRVTHFARGLLSRRTDRKAPSRMDENRPKLKGAHIPPPAPGRYEGVAALDFKGLYPSIILSYNLSWETLLNTEPVGNPENYRTAPNGTTWDQTEKGLLPSIVEYLFEERARLKQKMREADSEEERAGWNTFQLAVKRMMASLYGMCAAPGYGWGSYEIASTITAIGRESIHLLLRESEKAGYKTLAGHTDSSYIQVPFDEAIPLAERLTQLAQLDLDAPNLEVEFEAYFPYWTIAVTNRYFGLKSYPLSEAGQMKVAGFEYKSGNAAPVSKEVQGIIFNLISNGAEEAEVSAAVRPLAHDLMKANRPIEDITCWTRLSKEPKEYGEKSSVNAAKAALYYNSHVAKVKGQPKFQAWDSVPWVYVNGVPDGCPPVKVAAYQDPSDLDDFDIDWQTTVEKLVLAKIASVYEEAMGWNSKRAVGAPTPKAYW